MSFGRRKRTYSKQPEIGKSLTPAEAKRKLMDLVARRDHSEKELRKKLGLKTTTEIVEQTIEWAREQNWLAKPEKLKAQFADQLARRGKGIRQINKKLNDLGLGTVKADFEDEYAKAKKLISNKWSSQSFVGLDFKEAQKLKAKIVRYLASRGYQNDIISKILNNDLKKSSMQEEDFYDEEF